MKNDINEKNNPFWYGVDPASKASVVISPIDLRLHSDQLRRNSFREWAENESNESNKVLGIK